MTSQNANMAMVADTQPSLNKHAVSIPVPGPSEVLVEITHVAQNPTDVQSFDCKAFGDGAVYGCDFVGKAIQLGAKVTRVQKGEVVAGLIWGGETNSVGAYSQYTLADEKICFKLPASISAAQAATIPLAAATAWLALFSKDFLRLDCNSPQSVLIWGGSSSVGQYDIQLASLYHYNVVTTCSPQHFDLLKSLGATYTFDYRAPNIIEDIKREAPSITSIFDCIGNSSSSELASKVAQKHGILCTVRPGKANTEKVAANVKITDVLVWTAFLKDHSYGSFHWPASVDDHNLASELFEKLPGLLGSGKVKPNAVILLKGLDSVPDGFDMYRQGKISAQKIVYEL